MLKGAAGIYHQPPRFVLPLPGLDLMPIKYGLLRSFQTSLGVEVPLADKFQLTTEGYFNYMDPTIFDLSTNAASVGTGANVTLVASSSGGATLQPGDSLTAKVKTNFSVPAFATFTVTVVGDQVAKAFNIQA